MVKQPEPIMIKSISDKWKSIINSLRFLFFISIDNSL